MLRLVVFLAFIAVLALGASWVADQNGVASFVWNGWRIETSLPVVVFAIATLIVLAIVVWAIASSIWHIPERLRDRKARRRMASGHAAIAAGLIAIGEGDSAKSRKLAARARKLAANDPLTMLLEAQSAQLAGDHAAAQRAFQAMASRQDTRLLGLRGMFIEAQRTDAPLTAIAAAEEAVKISPSSAWASQAVLGFRCAAGDWQGALAVLEQHYAAGQIDKATHHRQRAVLLTAQALGAVDSDRDAARAAVMQAVGLAPTLVPAAALASKFHAEDGNVRKAMKVAAAAWRANPHPDLADAYIHVRMGDSARERLGRAQTLAAMIPDNIEGALSVARAAIDASEYAKARAALAPFVAAPTQRVAMLMAEIERSENGDTGRARQWTLRAVRASLDPAWTADGYVSDQWRPVSPLTGRLDAFRWSVPVAALPSSAPIIEDADGSPIGNAAPMSAPEKLQGAQAPVALPSAERAPAPLRESPAQEPAAMSAGAAAPAPAPPNDAPPPAAPLPPRVAPSQKSEAPRPLFRDRSDLGGQRPHVPPVIPVIQAPDDPGIDAEDASDAAEPEISAQPGGWRGAIARWVG